MSSTPNFTDPQFVDAAGTGGLNTAFGTVSGAIAALGSGAWKAPGLISPEAMTVTFSGLVTTVGLPAPWGLVNASGALIHAHGTQTGADTQSYTASFSGLVPSTGSVTAYLVASGISIQQTPFPIPGPPPGHPSYNPNFVPTIGYATNVGSVSLTATSGVPDNVTTFELFRTTLVPSQTSVSAWNTAYQQRALNREAITGSVLTSGGALAASQSQQVLYPSVPGLTHTLPLAAIAAGLPFRFSNPTSGAWTIAASGSDVITGFGATALSSFMVPSSGYMELWANGPLGAWEAKSAAPNSTLLLASDTAPLNSSTSLAVNQGGIYYVVGGSATTQTLPAPSGSKGVTFGFFAASGCTISTTTGSFQGGSLSGSTSIGMSTGDWIWVQSDGSVYRVISASPDIVSIRGVQAFTGNGSFTVPNGAKHLRGRAWGAGGGSGGATAGYSGAAGAGGNYAEDIFSGIAAGTSLTINVGTGGTAGTSPGGNGGNGGASSILNGASTLLLANGGGGGEGGVANAAGGSPGAAGTGTVQGTGGHGAGGGTESPNPMGGSCAMGGGGSGGPNAGNSIPGVPGGGAGGPGATSGGYPGTAGANGMVVIEWFS